MGGLVWWQVQCQVQSQVHWRGLGVPSPESQGAGESLVPGPGGGGAGVVPSSRSGGGGGEGILTYGKKKWGKKMFFPKKKVFPGERGRYALLRSRRRSFLFYLETFYPIFFRCRFDRIYLRHCTPEPKLKPVYFELIGLERLKTCRRFPSDHWGLLAHFDILSLVKKAAK